MGWAMAVAAILQVAQQRQQQRETKAWQEYQIAQTQADAQAAREASVVEAENIRKLGSKQRAAAIAAMAGSGIETSGQGTPLKIQEEITQGAEHDAYQTILTGKSQSSRMMNQAYGMGIQSKQDYKASNYRQASTLMSGAYQAYSGYQR